MRLFRGGGNEGSDKNLEKIEIDLIWVQVRKFRERSEIGRGGWSGQEFSNGIRGNIQSKMCPFSGSGNACKKLFKNSSFCVQWSAKKYVVVRVAGDVKLGEKLNLFTNFNSYGRTHSEAVDMEDYTKI